MAEAKATTPNIPSKRAKVTQDQAVPASEPAAPVFTRKLRKAAVGTGCDIRLRVSVAGCPKPSLAWYHNDEALPPSEAQDSGGLWIRDCHMCDAGLYTCVATNDLGEARTSALLAIMDLGDDSETTEDEATESQVPMETKEGAGRHQDKAGRRALGGDTNPNGSDRRATLPGGGGGGGGYDPVIERELVALGSRPPGSHHHHHHHLDPTNSSSARIQTADESKTPSSPQNPVPAPSPSHHTTSPSTHKNGIHTQTRGPSPPKAPDALDQSPRTDPASGSGVKSGVMTPKLARAAPKILNKVVAFEERRSSVELSGGRGGGSPWRMGRAASCDSGDGGGRKAGGPAPDAAQRRSSFKQRASSLEDDKVTYAQRVQSFQSKFTEELQRIKRLVGKPAMKKAYSTEQVCRADSPSSAGGRKLEPIPQQVVRKLEARERALEAEEGEGARPLQARSTPEGQRNGHPQRGETTAPQLRPGLQEKPAESSSSSSPRPAGKVCVAMETAPVHQLPGQPLPTVAGRSPTREILQSSSAAKPSPATTKNPPAASSPKPPSPSQDPEKTQLKPHPERDSKTEDGGDRSRSPSPTAKRTSSPVGFGEPGASRFPSRPPRLTPSPTPPVSPLQKRRKAEAGRSSPALKVVIPTIVVEDAAMEAEEEGEEEEAGQGINKEIRGKEGRKHKDKKGRSGQPRSPEEGGSSEDYMSADEGPEEGPRFERPLEDTTARAGSEVVLTCTVTGSPAPTVSWQKSNADIRGDALRDVRSQGKTHSLAIRQLRPGDAGTYSVTAVSAAGRAFCSATLYIQSEPSGARCGKPALSLEVGSPIQSDEEYLSPQEHVAMELGEPPAPPPVKHVHFRDPPCFQVPLCDQIVTEGHEVVICAKVLGQPKPVVYWSKDRVAVRSGGRFIVRETDDDTSEMRIASAQRADAGVYVCKLINEYGTKQGECRLEVRAAPASTKLTISRDIRDVAVKAGETAMFECHMTGPPDVEVDWMSNGKLVQPALLNCKMHFDGKRCRLLINSVHEDDSGTYTCKLSTAKEELTSSASLKVTPSKEPLFTRKLDVLEVIEGRTARFNCKVSGSPPPSITWMHFETPVEESDDVRMLREGGRYSLVIGRVSSDTEGFYTAVAQNFHGKAESTAELYMQEPRAAISSHMAKLEKMPSIPEEPEVLESEVEKRTMPDFVKPLADVEVIEGKEAVLKCKVTGLPYPTIAWYHNGKRIDSTEERKMTHYRDVHSLIIKSVCHAHGGVYKGVISNKVGKAACYAHLYITDIVPDPPDGPPVVEAITGKTITLSWKKPKRLDASLDASSLLYAVQQQPLGSIQWTIVASSLKEPNYTVTALSKGVRYAFRVLASTGKTLSKPSPSTDLVQLVDRGPYLRKAPVIVDKPDAVYVVENQPANITITLNHVHAVVTWKRRGVVLLNRPGMYEMSMPDDDQHNLKFQRVRATDVGQLVVTANNPLGSDLCTIHMAMAVPPKFESIMEDLDVDVGDTSRFAVVVEGKPDPDILWYKDDALVSESSRFTFVYDDPECSLVVLNASQDDSGVYTCTAKNLAGAVSCKAELTVHTERKQLVQPVEDEATILRKMRHLADYYDIHKEIGRGAFSYVKRVTQKKGKAEFAAKFISGRGKRKALALREMSVLSELDHERILYFHDAFEKKNMVVVITDLCHEELLDRMARKTTVMESEIRSSLRQVLEGLSYLHQKEIVHLDIKPENILMASSGSDQIRICDFGNATKLEASEEQYCKYGTPEYVAPEIVNQNPVSKATDIWPVGVITYLCLTGVSPFAGENDRVTVLNIRNANVAFEESMFSDLCKEARGFIIKLLVVDRLRPSAVECLRHPWFKSSANKSISTATLKQVLSRRRWQRSLISYKSKMVMRTIPELLNDSTNHISLAVARHLKEGSPPPSSSSDSDEDVDELPFIPMPLSMVFSGSRVSLNEIPGDEDVIGWSNGGIEGTSEKGDREEAGGRGGTNKTMTEEEMSVDDGEKAVKTKRVPLKKGSSVESDEDSLTKARRATMRRGSSADSALLLHVEDEEGDAKKDSEPSKPCLKKAVSMELPNRSPSPGGVKLSQEDYALKLELMRQRLLRGGSADKKMSGLRGPLFETLGMDDERSTGSLDRNLRRSRVGPPSLTRAASSETPGDDTPKTKVFKKSASFSQGDSEPMPLHRRFGAPLEIPSASQGSVEGMKLKEATSMSALTEQTTVESMPASPTDSNSFILPSPGTVDQQLKQKDNELEEMESSEENDATEMPVSTKDSLEIANKHKYSQAPIIVIEDHDDEKQAEEKQDINTHQEVEKDQHSPKDAATSSRPSSAYASVIQSIVVPPVKSDQNHSTTTPVTTTATLEKTKSGSATSLPEHPAVFARVASIDRPGSAASTSSASERPTTPHQPVLRTDIKDIDSEEVFESKFKKRESSLTRGLRRLTGNKSEEKSPVLSRKAGEGGEEVYRPGPLGSPLEMVTRGLQEKSKSVQDLRVEEKESGLGRIGRFSLRTKRSSSVDKKAEKPKEEKVKEEKPQRGREASPGKRRVTWAIGRSKSLDTKELDSAVAQGPLDEKEQGKIEESSVFAMRRKFESKVAGISAKIRTQSDDRKEKEAKKSNESIQKDPEQKDQKKVSDSPVLAMRHKFENKVAGISSKFRSQSEERTETEAKSEGKRTPLFTRHRHSQSEGRGLKGMGIPENQLAKQTDAGASKESINSTSSNHSEKVSHAAEGDRRSRWDRWGLTRSKKDKTPSQTDLPSSFPKEDNAPEHQQFSRSPSDFPPVFHIKLRDHVLLEGDPVTLSCLPAGSPHPQISWQKDKKPLEVECRMNLISHPDGRQLLMIMKTTRQDAGLYECVATNAIGTTNSSCTLSLACVPKRPGTPEIPQTYNNTALVLWKPADTKAPCTYTLERRTEGDVTWLIVATGVVDCYYNVTDLPLGGTFRFRVACVNKAGQGPYSNLSPKVILNPSAKGVSPPVVVVQTVPTPPLATSSITIPPLKVKPVQTHTSTKSVTVVSWSSASPKQPSAPSPPPPTTTSPSSQTATTPTTPPSSASSIPATVSAPAQSPAVVVQDVPAGSSPNPGLPSPPAVKTPPFVLPKPQRPNINVVSPMTQSPPLSPPPILVTPPSSPIKPAPASAAVPSYAPPPAATARVAPTQQVSAPTFSPHVLQMSSLSPLAEGMSTPARGTPSGRATPSNVLRQGVPQKPYTFLDEKARGRFGVIRDCRENATGKVYMAKIVPYDQESKPAILKEYEILKSLHNDKVMALHEAYVTPRYLVLVAEYCTGKELLYSLVDRFRYSEDDVVGYLVQILQGLEYLHNRRVLHLDLRPDNIMVTNLNVIKIVDFGSAQTFNPLSLKQYESSSGTLEYMAPEMLKGDLVGPPADVWTLGVVAFIMLSGRLPFQEKDPLQTEARIHMAKFEPSKLYPNVSQSASAFLKKMLSSYPWARPTTKDCFTHAWLQDSYLMKLRRQTLTFTTSRLKEFLVEQHSSRADGATKHKVLLRTYQSSPQTQTSDTSPRSPVPK